MKLIKKLFLITLLPLYLGGCTTNSVQESTQENIQESIRESARENVQENWELVNSIKVYADNYIIAEYNTTYLEVITTSISYYLVYYKVIDNGIMVKYETRSNDTNKIISIKYYIYINCNIAILEGVDSND